MAGEEREEINRARRWRSSEAESERSLAPFLPLHVYYNALSYRLY